jgi:aspartokinase-like uncharacterized kinase
LYPPPLIVVKLGGSLLGSARLSDLLNCTARAARRGLRIAIVPGGGPFADQVREQQRLCRFDDAAAHDMALLAMAQYGRLLGALAGPSIRLAWGAADAAAAIASAPAWPVIWLPDPRKDALDVERSWRIGADALALWLAATLQAQEVVLVKSCAMPPPQSLAALCGEGILDPAYDELTARDETIATTLVYEANASSLDDALSRTRLS